MKHLRIPPLMATAAVALSLVLGGCGSSSNTMEDPPPQPDPMPEADMGYVNLTAQQQEALAGVLKDAGSSDTVSVPAGGTAMRVGVTFTCNSMYPCTVTVTNSLNTIVAMWESKKLPDGMAGVMASGLEPAPETDPLAEQNMGNASSVAAILMRAIGADGDSTANPPTIDGAYDNADTTIGGLGLGDSGAMNIKGVSLTSNLNPNVAAVHLREDDTSTADVDETMGGSTMMAMNADGTYADYNMDAPNATVALEGWNHKVLFRDWGDTASNDDGGFETGTLIYSDMEPPTEDVPFDSKLAAMFVNASASYAFTVRLDGETVSDANGLPADAVEISVGGMANEQSKNIMLTVGAPQLETLVDTVERNSQHKGTYFGAMGTYRCVGMGSDDGCGIMRDEGGATPFGVTLGSDTESVDWVFKPDDDATIDVPDQDWMVYGAWLTTPDVMAGMHRVGVFYDGMDAYAVSATTNVFDETNANGLHGSAKYSGGAAGVYVDGSETGMFTARASLTANFDVDGRGDTDSGDNTISGRIDNFMGTDGTYLGTDTAMDPNDPTAGGENDWVVLFSSTPLDTADVTDTATVTGNAAGSADGVPWTGQWSGQLYGPGNRAAAETADAAPPTGVAGNFRAITGNIGTTAAPMYKGVVGAFGATKDD